MFVFNNLNRVQKCCRWLIFDCSMSIFTAYLHSNRGEVSIVVFQLLFFLLIVQVVFFH